MDLLPTVRLIQTEAEFRAVGEAARANGDSMAWPTHSVRRGGEIIGGVSIAAMPLILLWHHGEKVQARDSIHLIHLYESIIETKGFPSVIVACRKESPYRQHMVKLGNNPIWTTDLFHHPIGQREPVLKT